MSRGLGRVERTILQLFNEHRTHIVGESYVINKKELSLLFRCHEMGADNLNELKKIVHTPSEDGRYHNFCKQDDLYVTFSRALKSLIRKDYLCEIDGRYVSKPEGK